MWLKATVAAGALAIAVAGAALPAASAAAETDTVPGTDCTVFPANNVWNMDVSKMPKHKQNRKWKRFTNAWTRNLHPDFGPPAYGIPYDVVDDGHPTTFLDFWWPGESDPGPYPFGPDITIEGGSDRHAIMVNEGTCFLFELYAADWNGGDPTAGSGAIFDLASNDLRPNNWTSADAAGLPILPGLVRWDEVEAGHIDHAIRFTVACTRQSHVWPARHDAGGDNKKCPPMGARFRLKKKFDAGGYSPEAQVIIEAMKRYGLIVADNGSDWYFQGEVNENWTYELTDELKTIPAGMFVAVDTRACKVRGGSAEFAYGPGCPGP